MTETKNKAKGKKAKPKKKQPRGLTVFTESKSVPGSISLARVFMILGFAAAIPTVLAIADGRRLFWAAAIAVLPLFWVVGGYHLWRRLCPLAVFAQTARILGVPGKRRVNAKSWLARNYLLLQLGFMLVCLSLRLIMTNGTPWALVGFVIGATSVAILLGFFYTGKTWCNYVCPVGMVEKFYTEPSRLSGPKNSQCSPCTACKKNCPDIDLEQGYWKEVDQPARRVAYFAWPGIVLAFYTYYYLVDGSWDYYFSGRWTLETEQIATWLNPGFFFFEAIPIVVAAPLTLIAFGLASFGLFALAERIALKRAVEGLDEDERQAAAQTVRHRSLALAGFTAFITFYFFGGQPTIRMAPPWVGALFSVAVVIAASAIFFERWGRDEATFVKEKFAEKLLKKWEWGDAPPAESLHDVYVLHHEKAAQRESRVTAYKETVREMVADGLVTRGELVILDSLRAQLGVSDKEHNKALAELSDEERQLFDSDYQGSVELRLQQQQYNRDIETVIVTAARAGRSPDPADLEAIRAEHNVDDDEHQATLRRMLDAEGPVVALYREELGALEPLATAREAAKKALAREPASSSLAFLEFVSVWRGQQRVNKALAILGPSSASELADVREGRLFAGGEVAERARTAVLASLGEDLAGPLLSIVERLTTSESTQAQTDFDEGGAILAVAGDRSPYLRAAAAHVLSRRDDERARDAVAAATDDDEALVREAAYNALGTRGRLKRELMSKALKDTDPRVRAAAVNAMSRTSGRQSVVDTQAALDMAAGAATQGVYATLNADARMESLTTLEKMMLLRHVPMFAALDPDDLEQTTLLAVEKRFAAGDDLCREGDPGDDVFIIVSGSVEAWTGSGLSRSVLGTSGAGSCIGEMAVFDESPRSATVTATEPTRTLILPGEDFKSLMLARPIIGQSIIAVLVGRLRGMITSSSTHAP